jgi:Zn-dependent protease with chaperone function
MSELSADLHDGRTPIGVPVELVVDGASAWLTAIPDSGPWPLASLVVSPRVGRARRFVQLPDGRQLVCRDVPLLDRLTQAESSEGPAVWLERRPWVSGIAVLLTVAFLATAQRWLLPAVAELVAQRVPLEYERELGKQALQTLDDLSFSPSKLPPEKQEELRKGFRDLLNPTRGSQPLPAGIRLEFRDLYGIPNAFALPGGIVIVTDAVVESCKDDEVIAMLAHELGHVEKRHALRQLVLSAGTGALAAAVLGDASSIALFAGSAPAALLELKYSRELETQADDRAFDLLLRHGFRPSVFADALTCLERSTLTLQGDHAGEDEGDEDGAALSYLSTHPDTVERIRRFRKSGFGPRPALTR